MTIIELLAATVLAVSLMGAVLGILKSVTRAQKVVLDRAPSEDWQCRIVEQLEWDLTNSRSVVTTAAGFELYGFAGRDFISGIPLHGPTVIAYENADRGTSHGLLRTETHLDSTELHNQKTELVCQTINRIAMASPEADGPGAGDQGLPKSLADGPIPNRLAVCLYRAGESQPALQHAFTLR
jgi:hypothetical protein